MEIQNPLWVFALKVYAKPQVEACLLQLQEEYGLSINRLLFAGWLAMQHKTVELAAVESSAATCWQKTLTHPLRALRYQVRAELQADESLRSLYKAMRQAELQAEQIEIAKLYALSLELSLSDESVESLMLKNLKTVSQAQGISDEICDILSFLGKEMLSEG